jgi:lambda family phage portal protein
VPNPFAVAAQRLQPPPLLVSRRHRLSASTSWAGAAGGRLNLDWFLGVLSADQVLQAEIETLRTRAQELCMNNSTASTIPKIWAENVVGKDGILLQARNRTTRDQPAERINLAIEDAWYRWCEHGTCTVDGRLNYCETETLTAQSEPRDGEVLIQLARGFDNPFGFALDVLDPAQLDVNYNVTADEGRNEIRMGVEVNRWGRPLYYHLWTNHPSEFRSGRKRERVPESEIIHLYVQHRPKASRGVTWFAPVIIDLKNHGGYREAELTAARTAAAKMGWIQQRVNPDGTQAPPILPEDVADDHIKLDADPGVIEQLPPGYEFAGWDPTHPTTAFKEFDKAIIRSIAVAERVSYMSLSGDLSDTSYGSGRIGLLGERAVYEKFQQRHIERFSTPIYRAWLEMALLTGALQLPSLDARQYYACAWHARPFPWIDPAADMEAAETELALGVETYTRLAAKKGLDYEEVLQERQRERELRVKYGEPEPAVGKPAASAQPNSNGAVSDEDEDEEENGNGNGNSNGAHAPNRLRAIGGLR